MSTSIREIIDTADDVVDEVIKLTDAVNTLNKVMSYTLHVYRRHDTTCGYKSVEKKVSSLSPTKTLETTAVIPSIIRYHINVPKRRHSNNTYLTHTHYFYSNTFEKAPVIVDIYTSERKHYFKVRGAHSNEIVVIDEIPPKSLVGWIVVRSISNTVDEFETLPKPIPNYEICRMVESKLSDFIINRKLYGMRTTVRYGDYSVSEIVMLHDPLTINLSNIFPILERIELNHGGSNIAALERSVLIEVRNIKLLNPSREDLERVSRILDCRRLNRIRSIIYEVLTGVSDFIGEDLFEKSL